MITFISIFLLLPYMNILSDKKLFYVLLKSQEIIDHCLQFMTYVREITNSNTSILKYHILFIELLLIILHGFTL